MSWTVQLTPRAEKELERLSAGNEHRILDFLDRRVSVPSHPRALAKRLSRLNQEARRFHVGDHKIIVRFLDDCLIILVVHIGNRREVYR